MKSIKRLLILAKAKLGEQRGDLYSGEAVKVVIYVVLGLGILAALDAAFLGSNGIISSMVTKIKTVFS